MDQQLIKKWALVEIINEMPENIMGTWVILKEMYLL